jgi:hypothetical protein
MAMDGLICTSKEKNLFKLVITNYYRQLPLAMTKSHGITKSFCSIEILVTPFCIVKGRFSHFLFEVLDPGRVNFAPRTLNKF